MEVFTLSQPYVYPSSLPSLDLAASTFAGNLVAVYRPASNGLGGYVGWQKANPRFAAFSTLEPGGTYIVVSNTLGYELPDAPTSIGTTPVDLTAAFSPTQFGEDLLLWLDGQDASQIVGRPNAFTSVTSKGAVPQGLVPSVVGQASYDATEQAFSLLAGTLATTRDLSSKTPLIIALFKDGGAGSSGFAYLGYNSDGLSISRQPYGATASQFQVGAYSTTQNFFVDFQNAATNVVSFYADGSLVGARINGSQPSGATSQITSLSTTLPFSICAGTGDPRLFYEVLVVDGYYTYLAQLLEGYLCWKWNQVGLLPVGHPFKDKAPVVADFYDPLSVPSVSLGNTLPYILN